MYNTGIFIFRRGLRVNDNTGLIDALTKCRTVIPVFILTPEQLVNNRYKSDNAVQFMMESLDELDQDLRGRGSRLFYFFGEPHKILDKLIRKVDADSVFVNMDYTVYSTKRDQRLATVCKKHDCDLVVSEDYLLLPVGSVRTGGDEVYSKFTPFFNKAVAKKVRSVKRNTRVNYYNKRNNIVGEYSGGLERLKRFYKSNDRLAVRGGRQKGLRILRQLDKFKTYNKDRNTLALSTTRLSAYIKFGCLSIREVYEAFVKRLGKKNDLVKQLFWREFYFNISYTHPNTLGGKNRNFKEHYSKVPWLTVKKATAKQLKLWKAWTQGRTGFPVVDACMRELNTTGFMHNRGRLIVASFLTKNMMWSWEDGEMYFASRLVDYDPSVNNGNWGWVAGSGTDSMPYFRVFNAWTQSKKFDPDAVYIKRWVPELEDVDAKDIHIWNEMCDQYDGYIKPVLDHSKTREAAIKKYKKALD